MKGVKEKKGGRTLRKKGVFMKATKAMIETL